jgi:hypothetical protein
MVEVIVLIHMLKFCVHRHVRETFTFAIEFDMAPIQRTSHDLQLFDSDPASLGSGYPRLSAKADNAGRNV